MEQRPLGAHLSAMLAARGIETVFGIPGVHNIELYRGLEEAGLRHVLARHEQGAAFMADGYARATGQPGVCYLITGPGFANAMTPLGQAYADSVPVLAIASCLDETAALKGQLHQMRDQAGAGRAVCDWSETALSADAAYGLVDRALSEFATARARPKAIHLPIALMSALADPAPPATDQIGRLAQSDALAEDVMDHLRAARRPLFIFGGGVRSLLAPELMKRLRAASFVTYAARGLIPKADPLHFGGYLARPGSAEVVAGADLVVAIGTELSETDLWRVDLGHRAEGTHVPMIRVDIDPSVLADHHRADLQILADSHAFLMQLWNATEGWQAATQWDKVEIAAARRRWRAETDAGRPGIVPICDALRAAVPPDTMIFSDMTQFAYAAKEVWDMSAPGLWHHPTGFGTLGYALPAAIGGKIGVGDQPVMAIAGDYGFQYTLPELGTAAEEGLSLPILIWDNSASKEIEDAMEAAQIAPIAVRARNPDFKALAAAYGVAYAAPERLLDLKVAVRRAFGTPRPTLIRMTPQLTASTDATGAREPILPSS